MKLGVLLAVAVVGALSSRVAGGTTNSTWLATSTSSNFNWSNAVNWAGGTNFEYGPPALSGSDASYTFTKRS
jgi:hypothetical protein